MASTIDHGFDALVLVDETRGVTVIPQLAELRRLNWFDGKLLRADDLRIEQDHVRGLVRRANRAGGAGVVHGFTCTLAHDGRLRVGPGLAIDPGGRSLLLPVDVALDAQELIDRTARPTRPDRPPRKSQHPRSLGHHFVEDAFADCVEPEPAGEVPVGGARWYVVTVGWAEGMCGNEEVYGRLCEDACTTSTDRPWRIDGLVFRAHPLAPRTPLATSSAVALTEVHERSLLAAALFADELADAGSLIFGDGLRSAVWCAGAAAPQAVRDEVAIGVIARAGATTRFLDLWIARRERIEPPPQRYWAGRLAMRPWDVFLAQVLQFQCQLTDVLADAPPAGNGRPDPCAERQRALEDALGELEKRAAAEAGDEGVEDPELELLRKRVLSLRVGTAAGAGAQRILIDGGIVELPPAGYLPVDPAGPPSLEAQVRALMGAGVDLTYCALRHDALARAFQEAQHLDRISLLRGLDDPARREDVEVIVPDAQLDEAAVRDGWEGVLRIGGGDQQPQPTDDQPRMADRAASAAREQGQRLDGAGRVEYRDQLALGWAGIGAPRNEDAEDTTRRATRPSVWLEASTARDPFGLAQGEELAFSGAGDVAFSIGEDDRAQRASLRGTLRVESVEQRPGGVFVRGSVDGIGVLRSIAADGTEGPNTWTPKGLPVQLHRRATADGGTLAALRAEIDEDTAVIVTLTWQGEADAVEAVVHVTSIARDTTELRAWSASEAAAFGRELGRLTLHREPDAASPGHPARTRSEESLKRIERAVREPGYAQDARRRLFPAADDGVRLRPTRDWVLFRRRAVMRCGPLAPLVTATETFAVYGFTAPRQMVMTHVEAGGAARGFAYLGEVAFVHGSAQIVRGAQDVLRAWDEAIDDGVISAAGVIAGAPGGNDLGLRRADGLVDQLTSVTARGDEYATHVVEPERVTLDSRGADGVLVVAFQPMTKPVGVAIVAVDPQSTGRYLAAMKNGFFDEAMKWAFTEPHLLGAIAFPRDSANPSSQDDVEAVKRRYHDALGDQPVQVVDVVTVHGDPAAGSDAVRHGRGRVVQEVLGGEEVRPFEVEESVLNPARDHGLQERTVILVAPVT